MSKAKETPAVKIEEPAALAPTPRSLMMPRLWADPFGYMRNFNEEIERLFHHFGLGRGFPETGLLEAPREFAEMAKAAWWPQVELLEREGKLIVRADLPGLRKEDIMIEVGEQMLTIKGERRDLKEEKKETFYRSERNYGAFCRSFRLPEGVDASHAKAIFKDGVLEIELPAPPKPEKAVKKLEIKEPKTA